MILFLAFVFYFNADGQVIPHSHKMPPQPLTPAKEVHNPIFNYNDGKPHIYLEGSDSSWDITPEFIKTKPKLKVTQGYKLVSGNIHFAGTNFDNFPTGTFSRDSLVVVESLINKCVVGSSIAFDNVKVTKNNKDIVTIDGVAFAIISEAIAKQKREETQNTLSILTNLLKQTYLSGTIYFSGKGFDNVAILPATALQTTGGKALTARHVPGSIISFSACTYKDAAGKIAILTEVLKL